MASRELKFQVDLIGYPQFRRLVEFVAEVERHADEECDVTLQALVHAVHDDLLGMR